MAAVGGENKIMPSQSDRLKRMISISANTLRRMTADEWNIGIVHEPISNFIVRRPSSALNMADVHWFPRPRLGTYLADPFGVMVDKRIFVLCEEYDQRTSKGRIVTFEIVDDNVISGPTSVIEMSVHVSYPYLLEHEGEIYCIPETCQAGEIGLYRADKFPYAWRKVSTLIDRFAGVDPTVFWCAGRWWLACTNQEDSTRKLFLWYARELFGPWTSHAANPVKTDIRSSRPAGTPFTHDGHLYRPAQDCSITYGGRIVVNRIIKLTPNEFEEAPIANIEPNAGPYPHGLHTLSSAGHMCLVDGKRLAFVKRPFVRARIWASPFLRGN